MEYSSAREHERGMGGRSTTRLEERNEDKRWMIDEGKVQKEKVVSIEKGQHSHSSVAFLPSSVSETEE